MFKTKPGLQIYLFLKQFKDNVIIELSSKVKAIIKLPSQAYRQLRQVGCYDLAKFRFVLSST